MGEDWSQKEVTLIIEDYFRMLHSELQGEKYIKSDHRQLLLPHLNNRSDGSVEFKHQNISAVLAEVGVPFIKGYKPRYNYQNLLAQEVLKYVSLNKAILEPDFEKFSTNSVESFSINKIDFESLLDYTEPEPSILKESEPLYRPVKFNYLEREQNNRKLGEEGELLILNYEKWRLIREGKERLAETVEWVSKNEGDGTGFDILSKNTNGTDRYIEVKTTKLSKDSPIFLTHTEVSFAELKKKDFFLYRLFNFDSKPKFFVKNGPYQTYCNLKPQTFKGFF